MLRGAWKPHTPLRSTFKETKAMTKKQRELVNKLYPNGKRVTEKEMQEIMEKYAGDHHDR